MQTIRFGKGRGEEIPDISKLLMPAELRYAAKSNLPASEKKGILFYTTDTEEFFYGQGLGLPLGKMSDTVVIESESDLPEAYKAPSDKLFIIKETGSIYYWDDAAQEYKNALTSQATYQLEEVINRISELESIFEIKERVTLLEDNISEFILSKIPINEVDMFVNGVKYYYEKSFIYEPAENKIIWEFNELSGGFNLDKDDEIEFEYKYKEEEE